MAQANEVRMFRGAQRRRWATQPRAIQVGLICEAIASGDPRWESASIGSLIGDIRRVGPQGLDKFCAGVGLSPLKTVGSLTVRQSDMLIAALERRWGAT